MRWECTRPDNFSAVGLDLGDSGSLYFYLPKDGVEVNALASDPEILNVIHNEESKQWSYPDMKLSVPKFKVSANANQLETLKQLGVTDALNPDFADFTPLTDLPQVYLEKAGHAAMVETDEKGVIGVAYTVEIMEAVSAPMETMDFVLDRPFLFVITGQDGAVLFSGIVRNFG